MTEPSLPELEAERDRLREIVEEIVRLARQIHADPALLRRTPGL